MTWREDLQAASYRGVPFDVEGDSGTFGRRTQVHEYPQRDKPFAEDLGRATRQFDITAFVIGDDYLQRRDALLAALEAEGPGALVHPWYGELQVNVREPARVSHSRFNGGMCEIALSFVEAGELEFPAAADSLGARTLLATDATGVAAAQDFADTFAVDGWPSFVQDGFFEDLGLFTALLDAGVGNWRFLDLAMPAWMGDALQFADGVIGMFSRTVLSRDVASASRLNRNAIVSLTALSRQYGGLAGQVTASAPATRQRQINRSALAVLFQRATLVQAGGMAAAGDLPVYDDAVLVRDSVTAAIEEASFDAADAVYVQLQLVRARVFADITARLRQAARLLEHTPREPIPGLVLAYDLYEDVARESEILERNAIRHPGFLPAIALKVLSE